MSLPAARGLRDGVGMTEMERPKADVALKQRARRLSGPGDDLIVTMASMIATDRADCCSAAPVMRAVLPATSARVQPAELLLCAHHCRSARTALARAAAAVYDASGQLLSSGEALARDGRQLWLPA